ncbi:MAG: CoA-binding protein [Deltaproteobacteria bacterium]|uniref:CoA-binding protein n=1 Tax=Candidatus Zymogenus saltonus TaxID=2844893 RepID=A0A9D8PLY2_9DELT|nr:CoA-binding protein [Candidatus Zymogenus saltonus]
MKDGFKTKLDPIFYPESVAIIGASNNFAKWGSFITAHMIVGGYLGKIYPINPKKDTIYGRKAYKNIADVPGKVDLAIITTPAKTVFNVVKECIEKKVGGIVVVTSGFSETDEEGIKFERELAELLEKAKIPMVGPNTMGVMCTQKRLFSIGAPLYPHRGDISFMSQSGNLGNQMLEWAEMHSVGMGKFVGSGNEALLKKSDFLRYFKDDPDTKVILLYVEGVEEGEKFLEIAQETTKRKPIVALKGGRTEAGGVAARSHTGSLAGDSEIITSAFRQAGIIEARTPTDMLDYSMALDNLPLPKGDRVGIITLGGGWGVVTSDNVVECGLTVAKLGKKVIDKLDKILPPFWSKRNPVDLVGQINPEAYVQSVEAVTSSDDVDAVICLGIVGVSSMGIRSFAASATAADLDNIEYAIRQAQGRLASIERSFLDKVNELMNEYKKPIINVSLYAGGRRERYQSRTGYSEVVYSTPEKAVQSLAAMYEYYKYLSGHGITELKGFL